MELRPLTLASGGSELARLIGQLVVPQQACSFIGSTEMLDRAGVPDAVSVPIDGPDSIAADRLQASLAASIVQAIDRVPDTQRLIVALDDTDDVASAALTVLSSEVLRTLVRLDGIVATTDAVQMSTRLMTEQVVETPVGLDRLAIADRILVARSCDVTPTALGAVAHVLRSINQTGPVIAPAIARCTFEDLLDLHAWSGSPTVGPRPAHPSPFLGPDAPSMVVCRAAKPLDPEALDQWLGQVLTDHDGRVLRVLGTVSSTADHRRTYLHGVRGCLLRSRGVARHLGGGTEPGLVALVGRQLPAEVLQRSFSSSLR